MTLPLAWIAWAALSDADALPQVLMRSALPMQMLRSALLAAACAAGAVAIGAGAAVALMQLQPRGQRRAAMALLLLAAAPANALWLGRFAVLRALGLGDTPLALLLPPLSSAALLSALLLWRAFARVGAECIDAARLDAGSHAQVLGLLLGASRPAVALVAALSAALAWGDALSPALFASSPALATWPVGLSALAQLERAQWSVWMAGALLVTVPVLAMLTLMRRRQ